MSSEDRNKTGNELEWWFGVIWYPWWPTMIISYNFLWRPEVITSSLRNEYVPNHFKILVPTSLLSFAYLESNWFGWTLFLIVYWSEITFREFWPLGGAKPKIVCTMVLGIWNYTGTPIFIQKYKPEVRFPFFSKSFGNAANTRLIIF